jgi:hypothetical protein
MGTILTSLGKTQSCLFFYAPTILVQTIPGPHPCHGPDRDRNHDRTSGLETNVYRLASNRRNMWPEMLLEHMEHPAAPKRDS